MAENTTSSPNGDAPTGRDDVRRALVASATKLFTETSPGSVTIKTIAADARVNHGLVHRHFGTKLDLAQAVLESAADEVSGQLDALDGDPVATVVGIIDGAISRPVFGRVLGWAMLEDIDPSELVTSAGLIRTVRSVLENAGVPEAAQVAADLTAATLGWSIYEAYLLHGPLEGMSVEQGRARHLAATERQLIDMVAQARTSRNAVGASSDASHA